jgi:predicted transcriptional regulator YdeE
MTHGEIQFCWNAEVKSEELLFWGNAGLPRAFTTDFEVYDERSQNPENAEVDIFVAVK